MISAKDSSRPLEERKKGTETRFSIEIINLFSCFSIGRLLFFVGRTLTLVVSAFSSKAAGSSFNGVVSPETVFSFSAFFCLSTLKMSPAVLY